VAQTENPLTVIMCQNSWNSKKKEFVQLMVDVTKEMNPQLDCALFLDSGMCPFRWDIYVDTSNSKYPGLCVFFVL
jgi:hypothetical protein